jgi:membrane-associated protease RseP (regulator of RpoE activity)
MAGRSDGAAREDLEPLLREHRKGWEALRDACHRCATLGADHPEAPAAEERAAALFDARISASSHILFEALRRGISVPQLEARLSTEPDLPPLDPSSALVAAMPGGPGGPEVKSWTAAAKAGRPAAMYMMAAVLEVLPGDHGGDARIQALLERAAAAGHGPSMRTLGLERIRTGGDGAAAGEALLLDAARKGNAGSGFLLFETTWRPDAPPQRRAAAMEALRLAAEAGHAEARLALGHAHATGERDLPRDHARAKEWLALAAEDHCLLAREWLDRFGDVAPDRYGDAMYLARWTPDELPPAGSTGRIGFALSLGFLALLVGATLAGNSLGAWLLFAFVAVLMHEFGHYWVGRRVGIPMVLFSFGIGPVVRSFVVKEGTFPMRVDVRLLPLMGSVTPYSLPRRVWDHLNEKRRCAAAGAPPPPLPRFDEKEEADSVAAFVPRSSRLAMIGGGLLVNLLAAIGCLWVFAQASPVDRLHTAPVAGRVPPGSVAEAAGIREGDRFRSVGGEPVVSFFPVQRRLAPAGKDGKAAPPADPPGSRIEIVVERDGRTETLAWIVPPAPPAGAAAEGWGLLPPVTWRVARVHREGGMLRPGDEILAWGPGRKEKPGPGGHGRFHQHLLRGDPAEGGAPGTLWVDVRRDGGFVPCEVLTVASGEVRVPGVEFERLREPGPPDSLGEVLGEFLDVGRNAVLGLPAALLESILKPSDPARKGWLFEAVAADPWRVLHVFGFLHAFLFFLNLLPIPPLDGFQMLCCAVEMAARRPLPKGGVQAALKVGWVLMAAWLALNAILVLKDLAGSVL